MMPAYDQQPGKTSMAQSSADPATAPTGTPGKQTLTQQLPAAPAAPAGSAPAASAAPTAQPPGTGSTAATYTVQPGDSLASIAAKLGTTVAALKATNADKLRSFPTRSGNMVQGFNAGEVIAVPAATASPTPPPPAASPAPASPTSPVPPAASPAPASPTSPAPPAASPAPAPAAPASPAPPATDADPSDPPLAGLTDAQRGAQLSTMTPTEGAAVDKFGMSKTGRAAAQSRGQWLGADSINAAGSGKSGDAFVAGVDAMVAKTNFTADQDKVISSAKDFAAAPQPLSPDQEAKAAIDWSKAQLSLDGVSLNDDLKGRLTRYVRFLAWAGLVTGPTSVGSVMRSASVAHKLSVAWMFNLTANASKGSTLHSASNRQKLVQTVTASGGSDADGNTWLGPATVDGLRSHKDDDAALFDYIKTTAAPEANQVQVQPAIAAEGYKTADKRHPNVLSGTSVSNHLLGEAVDMYPPFVFSNKFDPMIDAIAAYFGLWRAVKDNSSSPEHWHYERLGMPPGAEPEPL